MTAQRVATEEDAANLALSLLTEGEIASLDDGTKAAREARKWFGTARDAVLRRKWWNFNRASTTPAAQTGDFDGALALRYPLPPDCVMVREVFGGTNDDRLGSDDWEVVSATATISGVPVEVTALATNAAPARIVYSRRVTNFALWDPEAVIAFAKELAALMAPAFGKTFAETEGRSQSARNATDKAAAIDAREKAPQRDRRDTSIIAARRGFRGCR